MKNGLLYLIYKFIFDKLKFLTIVELFKLIGEKLNPNPNDINSKLAYSRTAVDVFIILKWVLIFILSKLNLTNDFLTILVWYLLITNLYSYFYYHIWKDEALNTEDFEMDRIRRRFVNLILAFGYSNFSFAYLYKIPYSIDFKCTEGGNLTFIKSIWFSFSNSLGGNYDAVCQTSDFGYSISMIQFIITFIFITIILGKSIPQTNSII